MVPMGKEATLIPISLPLMGIVNPLRHYGKAFYLAAHYPSWGS